MTRNIIISAFRVFASFALKYFSTPLIIGWVGVSDFGMWVSITASLTLIAVVNEAVSSSVQRQLSAAIAGGDNHRARVSFTVSFCIFSILAFCFLTFGFVLKDVFLEMLNIAEDRRSVADLLYIISMFGTTASLLSIPFQSILVSGGRQDLVGVGQLSPQILQLVAIAICSRTDLEPMRSLAIVTCFTSLLTAILPIVLASANMKAARLTRVAHFWSESGRFLDFALWNLAGRLNWILRNAGTTVLLSSHFGHIAAAGFTVANNAIISVLQFSFASMGVVQVEMTASEVRRDRERSKLLASRLSLCYSLFGVFLIYSAWGYGKLGLEFWLKTPPDDTYIFLVYAAIYQTAAFISIGEALIMEARGQIRGVTVVVALPQLIVFGVGALLVWNGRGDLFLIPQLTVAAACLTSFALRPVYLHFTGAIEIKQWTDSVVIPVLLSGSACGIWMVLSVKLFGDQISLASFAFNMIGWLFFPMAVIYWKARELLTLPARVRKIFYK